MDDKANAVEGGLMLQVAYAECALRAIHQTARRGVVGCVDIGVADEVACGDVDEVIVKECKKQVLRFYVTCD